MHTDVRHYMFFSACQFGRMLFSAAATALLARLLDPSGLGRWTMLLAAATLVHSLFANWLQQDVYLRFGKQEWTASHTLAETWGARLPLLAAGLAFSLLIFTLFWNSAKQVFQLDSIDGWLAFAYMAALLVSIDLQTLLQITGRMDRLALAPVLLAAASVLLYGCLLLGDLSHRHVEISLLGTALLTLGIWLVMGIPAAREAGLRARRWNPDLARRILHYAWPILPTTILGYLANWGNQVFIQRSFSSHDVGLYQAAFQVHSMIVTLAVPLSTILGPRLIDKHLEDSKSMNRFLQVIAPTLFSLWLLAIIPTVTLLPWVFMAVYGTSFGEGLAPLTALLIGTPFCAVGQIYTGLFTVQGSMGKIFWLIFAMVVVNFTMAWVLVLRERANVQTVALAFTAGFFTAQCLVFYFQHHALKEPVFRMGMLLLAALSFSIGQFFLPGGWSRVLWGVLGTVALILTVRLTRAVDKTLLENLFSGRLAPGGRGLVFLLTARS